MKKHLLILCTLFLAIQGYGQLDGWTKGKGNTDIAIGATFEQGTGFYAGTERTTDITRTKVVGTVFAAHGLTKDLDVILNIPYVNVSGTGGLQDLAAWLKWAPIQPQIADNWKMSFVLGAGYSLPMTDYETETIGAIGQANTAAMGMGLLQFQNTNTGFFFNVSGGYFVKSDPTPDLIPLQFKIGLAKTKYYAELYFDMGESQGGKDYLGEGDLAAESFKELGASWLKVGGKWYKPFNDKHGLAIEGFKVLDGRNYDDSFGLAASLIWKIPARKKSE